jgi:hypothetical protein
MGAYIGRTGVRKAKVSGLGCTTHKGDLCRGGKGNW